MMLPFLSIRPKQVKPKGLRKVPTVTLAACLTMLLMLGSGAIVLGRGTVPQTLQTSAGGTIPSERLLQGGRVYRKACQMCHGDTGLGKSSLGPALLESIWLRTCNPPQISAVMLHGIMGALPGGQPAHPIMPGVGFWLSDQEIADVATYTVRIWGRRSMAVAPETVAVVRAQYSGRQTPWTLVDLEKHFSLHASSRLASTP